MLATALAGAKAGRAGKLSKLLRRSGDQLESRASKLLGRKPPALMPLKPWALAYLDCPTGVGPETWCWRPLVRFGACPIPVVGARLASPRNLERSPTACAVKAAQWWAARLACTAGAGWRRNRRSDAGLTAPSESATARSIRR